MICDLGKEGPARETHCDSGCMCGGRPGDGIGGCPGAVPEHGAGRPDQRGRRAEVPGGTGRAGRCGGGIYRQAGQKGYAVGSGYLFHMAVAEYFYFTAAGG